MVAITAICLQTDIPPQTYRLIGKTTKKVPFQADSLGKQEEHLSSLYAHSEESSARVPSHIIYLQTHEAEIKAKAAITKSYVIKLERNLTIVSDKRFVFLQFVSSLEVRQ